MSSPHSSRSDSFRVVRRSRDSRDASPGQGRPHIKYKLGKVTRVNDYQVRKQIGEGGFSQVLLASKKGELYAIKHMHKASLNARSSDPRRHALPVFELPGVKKEIAVLKKLAHPNIVQMTEVGCCGIPHMRMHMHMHVHAANNARWTPGGSSLARAANLR